MTAVPVITTPEAQKRLLIPAIRTPDLFERALERVSELIEQVKAQGPDAVCEELDTLRIAIREAPFVMRRGKVVPKGFSPRTVR